MIKIPFYIVGRHFKWDVCRICGIEFDETWKFQGYWKFKYNHKEYYINVDCHFPNTKLSKDIWVEMIDEYHEELGE